MSVVIGKHATDARPFAGLDVSVHADTRHRIDFVLGLRHHWAHSVFVALRDQYQTRVNAIGAKPRTGEEAGPVVESLPLYPVFAWLERNIQKMMWRALTEACEADREQLVAALNKP